MNHVATKVHNGEMTIQQAVNEIDRLHSKVKNQRRALKDQGRAIERIWGLYRKEILNNRPWYRRLYYYVFSTRIVRLLTNY